MHSVAHRAAEAVLQVDQHSIQGGLSRLRNKQARVWNGVWFSEQGGTPVSCCACRFRIHQLRARCHHLVLQRRHLATQAAGGGTLRLEPLLAEL